MELRTNTKRRLAASFTLAAAGLVLLGMPLVIGAVLNMHDARFVDLMTAALVTCTGAIACAAAAQILRGEPRLQQRPTGATIGEQMRD